MQIGDKVPAILGIDEQGHTLHSQDFLGKTWLLYFYPKDNTSGCTAQACSLRDNWDELQQVGLPVVGVSKDPAASHRRFREQHALPFPLIVDTEHKLQEQMGVWVPKRMYGREYMGTERTSFLIDPEGKIIAILRGKEVNTKEHAAQILNLLKK